MENSRPTNSDLGASALQGSTCEIVSIDCRRHKAEGRYQPGDTLLEAARRLGLRPPYSCQSGSCGNCIAEILSGTALMRENQVLTPSEIEAGYILTCQAIPTSREIAFVYEL